MCRRWLSKHPNPAAWARAAAILFVSIVPAMTAAAEPANLVANGDFSKTSDRSHARSGSTHGSATGTAPASTPRPAR